MTRNHCIDCRSRRVLLARRGLQRCTAIVALALAAQAQAQTLVVEPASSTVIQFSGVEGGPFAAEGDAGWTLTLLPDDISEPGTLAFTAESDAAWLTLDPAGATLSAEDGLTTDVEAVLDGALAGAMPAGIYSATVSFTNTTNGLGTTTRTVQLAIAPASFDVSPAFVNVIAAANDASPIPDVVVTLTNRSLLDLDYKLSWPTRTWLSITAPEGVVPGGGSTAVRLRFNPAGQLPGRYQVDVSVANLTTGAGDTVLPVILLVRAAGAGAVTLSPDKDIVIEGPAGVLSYSGVQHNVLANGSDRFVLWSATADAPWVSISPLGGELAPNGESSGLDEQAVDIRANAGINDLPAGSHTATVTFSNLSTGVPIATRVLRVVADPRLRLPKLPPAGGSIALSPLPLRTLPDDEGRVYTLGDLVTLTANVQDGWRFESWYLDDEDGEVEAVDDNPAVIVMNRSRVVSVSLVPIARTLTLSSSGSGTGTATVSPLGTAGNNALITKYDNGTEVVMAATADSGSVFAGWAGNVPAGLEDSNPLRLTMDRDRVITAVFEPEISLGVEVEGEGTVTVNPDLDSYPSGTEVTLTAIPADGYVFERWSGDASATTVTLTLTLTERTEVTAEFVEDDGTDPGANVMLTVSVEGSGTVTPAGGEFARGTRVVLLAVPGTGAAFDKWEGDVSGTELAVEVMMTEPRDVRAVFRTQSDTPGGEDPGSPVRAPCGAMGLIGWGAMWIGLIGTRRARRRM